MYSSESPSTAPQSAEIDMSLVAESGESAGIIALPDGPSIESLTITPAKGCQEARDSVIGLSCTVPVTPGAVGLQNIGNTCFMNSVLQCLLHCEPLCEYFASGRYIGEINTTNPLGTGGKLATEFAKLVEDVWVKVVERVVVPRDLKYVIGQHAPMFLGYQQQDSQELVTFLLDGLHEDLNLVKEKPYTVAVEADGRPDAEVAEIAWNQHLERNQSEIVSLFQGQYKSRLCCPNCNKSSVTFDPFMYLSLPIPNQPDLSLLVTFTSGACALPPVRFSIHIFRDASHLPRAIAAAVAAELPPEYSEEIVTNDILVYVQGNSYSSNCNSFELMDKASTSFLYGSRKKIFCAHAPGISRMSTLSPPISPRVSDEAPAAKRSRHDSIFLCVQTRIGRKSKLAESFACIGAPAVIAANRTISGPDLIGLLKRTVLHSTGSRSRELMEGLKNGIFKLGISGGNFFSLNGQVPDELLIRQVTESPTIPLPVFVDLVIDDSNCKTYDWSEDDGHKQSWEDLEHSIHTKVGDYCRTEASWKAGSVASNTSATAPVSIDDCFKLFSTEEVLGHGDEWFCAHCKKHVCASKKIELWRMPQILIIHLKRFQYTRGFRNKIEAVIDFPVQELLDVERYLPESALSANGAVSLKYSLFGISNHSGSLYSGHYTAYSKLGNDWYSFNDSFVSRMEGAKPSPDSSSYLLFYKRV